MQAKVKNILSGVLFLLGLAVLLAVASLVFRPKNNMKAYGMEDPTANGILSEPEQTIDVLFLGDSVSYCSIIPIQIWRDYGITSYLCGTSQQQLYYTKEFLEKAFETQTPQIVFLGTTPIFSEFMYKESVANKVEQVLPIFRYHDRWKEMGTWPEWEQGFSVDYAYREIAKGYRYSLAVEPLEVGDYTKPTDVVEPIPEICREAVEDIKAFCDEHGAELVLLSEPNTSGAWGPHRHNAIVQLAGELGVEYVDMNYLQEEVPIDWTRDAFDNGDHLNYYGAQKVSAYLGKYLSDRAIFTDKRKDERYSSWNEDQNAFYELFAN